MVYTPIHIYNESNDTTLCGKSGTYRYGGVNRFFVSKINMPTWGEYKRLQMGFFSPRNMEVNCSHCVKELDHLLMIHALEVSQDG